MRRKSSRGGVSGRVPLGSAASVTGGNDSIGAGDNPPVNQDGAVLFFQLINARHQKASTVLTSNKGFEDWGGVLGDEVMAAALIDRLVHHCHIVNIRGNSYRMRDHQKLLQSSSDRRRKRAAA